MNDLQERPGLLRRAWQRALDGDRQWGAIEVRPERFGVMRYRLVVYPPGLDEAERRRVRVARGWPLWGVAAWIVAEIWASQLTGPWTALAISTTAVLCAGLVATAMAGEARGRVRTMYASNLVGHHDPVAMAAVDKLRLLAGCLIEADDALASGRLSPTEYEMLWWKVYDEIGSDRAEPAVR